MRFSIHALVILLKVNVCTHQWKRYVNLWHCVLSRGRKIAAAFLYSKWVLTLCPVRARRTVYTILLITVRRRKRKKNRRTWETPTLPHSVELTRLSARSSFHKNDQKQRVYYGRNRR